MIYFAGLALLCVAYVAVYARRGITHPIALFFLGVFILFPFKYFVVEALGISYAGNIDLGANQISTSVVNFGGALLLSYFVLSALVHRCCGVAAAPVPLVLAAPRVQVAMVSVCLGLLLVLLYVAAESPGALAESLRFRAFAVRRGMNYVTQVYELAAAVGLVQLLAKRRRLRTAALLSFHAVLGLLMGRTALAVGLVTLVLLYLNMVRRKVPHFWFGICAIALPVLALVHGLIRTTGGFAYGSLVALLHRVRDATHDGALRYVASEFVNRINQLEDFSVLADALRVGTLKPDLFWPLYVLVQFVPRALWPDKPLFFTAHMTNTFYPLSWESGTSFVFLGVGEMIYAFHFPGIILAALVTGYFLHTLDAYYRATVQSPAAFVFFYTVIWFFLTFGFQAGWLNSEPLPFTLINVTVLFFACRVYHVSSGVPTPVASTRLAAVRDHNT